MLIMIERDSVYICRLVLKMAVRCQGQVKESFCRLVVEWAPSEYAGVPW